VKTLIRLAVAAMALMCGVLVASAPAAAADGPWYSFKNGVGVSNTCMEDQWFVKPVACDSPKFSQHWLLVYDSGYYRLMNRNSRQCIGFNGHAGEFGQGAFTEGCTAGTYAQQFTLPNSPINSNYVEIRARLADRTTGRILCLTAEGGNVIELPCDGRATQAWRFIGPK
jgi:hypothetical protein